MKIKEQGSVIVELSFHELRALWKLMGPTSFACRRDKLKMTDEENSAIAVLYSQLDNLLNPDGSENE